MAARGNVCRSVNSLSTIAIKCVAKSCRRNDSSQMNDYTIAVVIPAYNAERYICEALDSVVGQRRLPEQIIVVDDGSVDHTAARVLSWRRDNFPGLILRQQSNRGVSTARNTGLRHVEADLIAFLDSDDLWLPHHLERLETAFKRHPELLVCFGDTFRFDSQQVNKTSSLVSSRIQCVNYHEEKDGLRLMQGSVYASLVRGNYVCLSASLVSKKALERVGAFDEAIKSAEDRLLFLRLSVIGQFAYYPCIVAHKRVHDNNLTHPRHQAEFNRYKLMVLQRLINDAEAMKLSAMEREQTRAALSEQVWNMLYIDFRAGFGAFLDTFLYLIRHRQFAVICNPNEFCRAALSYYRTARKRQTAR
jgi:glycosyltransferase involved in cell wall biosynthesis